MRESTQTPTTEAIYVGDMADSTQRDQRRAIAAGLADLGDVRTYRPRSFIFHHGDPGGSVLLVETGVVRIDRTTASGKVVLINLMAAGEIFGELSAIDNTARSASAATVTEARVRRVQASEFRDLLHRRSDLQAALLESVTSRLRSLTTQFVENSSLDAPALMAAGLLRLVEIEQELGRCAVEADGAVELRLIITQEELGQWSGLSREGAVKGLASLRSIGLIDTGRKRVTIHDLSRLREWV